MSLVSSESEPRASTQLRHPARSFRARSVAVLALAALAAGLPLPAAGEPAFYRLRVRAPARIRIEAARFRMGSDDDAIERALQTCLLSPPGRGRCGADLFADEKPEREIFLSAYAIDRLEVSNRDYLRCVSAGACAPSGLSETDPRVGRPDQPVAAVSWREASDYCRWVHGRLPTEAQWERAARGDTTRTFPWGDVWNPHLANHGDADGGEVELDGHRFAAPVDAYPDGRSIYGLQNMAGNVWELVADRYGTYDAEGTAVDPQGPAAGAERVMRGGSWRSPPHTLRVTSRARIPEGERRPDVGFRCAYPRPRVPRR